MRRLKYILRKLKSKLPSTYLGFPIDEDNGASRESVGVGRRGVAMIIAIMAVAMVMIFSSHMIVNSSVNMELSTANRDGVKAEYMAKSGMNLAIFLLSIDWALDLFTFQMTQKPPTDGSGDIWGFLNGMPIGGDTMEMIAATQEQFSLSNLNDENVLDTLKLFDGQFVIDISDEMSKINIAKCNLDACRDTVVMLEALMSCPAEKAFLERKNLVPRQMANRIKDWIDDNSTPSDTGFSSEDDPYEKKSPPYKSKNVPLESVNELMLIEGWDEEVHAVFSPYITIYPYIRQAADAKQININTSSKELLGCLIPTAKTECREKFFKRLIDNQDKETQRDFATDKQSVASFVSDELCSSSEQQMDEEERRQGSKSDWFTYRSSVFRVKVTGEVGSQERQLELVIERTIPDKAKKMEYSYNILYWKMI